MAEFPMHYQYHSLFVEFD